VLESLHNQVEAAGDRRPSLLDQAPKRAAAGVPVVAALGTVVVHGALVLVAMLLGIHAEARKQPTAITQMVEVELPTPPPPAPEPEPEPEAPEPVETVAKPARKPVLRPPEPVPEATREAPPPAAAQAGQVLTAPEEMVDFGEAIVAGQGAAYAGGVTEAGGTSARAVRDTRARAGGVEGGTGTDLAGDKSRAPRLAGRAEWDCPFPEEADDEGIESAVVTLKVEVGADGEVINAHVTADPGFGFGREARRCAQRKPWAPGLDRAGNPTRTFALVNVRFTR
jgi:outer membrane biosynthesis protein TonB